jgi:hypothetical protein
MLSLALTCLIFVFWGFTGLSILGVCSPRLGLLKNALLAPVVGLSTTVLALMVANQAGFPIQACAKYVTGLLLILASCLYLKARPKLPFKALLPYFFIFSASLIWISWPSLKLHFNWLSFVTDDYVNYCLSADRFKQFGFYRVPLIEELRGSDYTQHFWFMHAIALIRFGAEHQLAWVSSLTGLRTLQIFMPTIIALGLVQLSSVAGLVLYKGHFRRYALIATLLLALSPLYVYSLVYQRIAQVGGLGMMLGLVALMTARFKTKSRLTVLRISLPTALIASALAMFYPEVSPFAAISIFLFFFLEWFQTRTFPSARAVLLQYVLVLFFILLRFNVISYIYGFFNQLESGLGKNDLALSLFPFFLIPSGIPALLGIQDMAADIADPWGSILFFLAVFFLILVLFKSIRQIARGFPIAVLFVVQGAVAFTLFRSGNDFGTYKMAMFMQPALMAVLASVLIETKPRIVGYAGFMLLSVLMITTDIGFTQSSAGKTGTILAEVQNASAVLSKTTQQPKPTDYWFSGIDNMIAAKLATSIYQGGYVRFPSRDPFPVSHYIIDADWPLMQWYPHKDVYFYEHKLFTELDHETATPRSVFGTDFSELKLARKPTHYLNLTSERNLFNKMHPDGKTKDDFFVVTPVSDAKNTLIFIHSSLGSHYYFGDRRNISFYQQERDYYDAEGMMNGIGRFLLLRVENPTPEVYLRLAATKTLMSADHKAWSTQASVKATHTLPIPLFGSGAANVFVGPIKPVKVGDGFYIALDMGEEASPFTSTRTGLKALYNYSIPLDYRWLVGYGRDISVISPVEYESISRPTSLENFPAEIVKAQGLEFSGIYEDGWTSPESKIVLGNSNSGDVIRLRLQVPKDLQFSHSVGELKISVTGSDPIVIPVGVGDFDWLMPISNPGIKTDLRLSFSNSARLAKGDDRVVSAKIESIKILTISKVDFTHTDSPKPPTIGIDPDGWCEEECFFDMPVSSSAKGVILTLDYPGWWNVPPDTDLKINLDNAAPQIFHIKQGRNTLSVVATPGASVRRVHIKASQIVTLPKPDSRARAFCLVSAESNDERALSERMGGHTAALYKKIDYAKEGSLRPPSEGINSDGWSSKRVVISLPVLRDSNSVTLKMEYPGWTGLPAENAIAIRVDGGKPYYTHLKTGMNMVTLPEPIGFTSRTIVIEANKTFIMPGTGDGRECAYRLIEVSTN